MIAAVAGTNKNPKKCIDYFGGRYHFLCNFYERPLEYGGRTYLNSEAAFAAQKAADTKLRKRFTKLGPQEAKSLGRYVTLRPDWDAVKFTIMSEVVHAKFAQHPDLRKKLLATGKATLVEGNFWGDKIWGTVKGKGTNWLGVILMAEREYWKAVKKHV